MLLSQSVSDIVNDIFLLSDIPLTTNSPAVSPLIVSDPLEISKPRGDTAQFHCKVKHLGKLQTNITKD